MIRPLVLRRPDGIVEIRRARLVDLILLADAATLLLLFGAFVLFALTLFLALVYSPIFLAIAAWAGLRAALEVREAWALEDVDEPLPRAPRAAA